eukprot:g5089.t1
MAADFPASAFSPRRWKRPGLRSCRSNGPVLIHGKESSIWPTKISRPSTPTSSARRARRPPAAAAPPGGWAATSAG